MSYFITFISKISLNGSKLTSGIIEDFKILIFIN